jgi:hypothetical protein
MHGSEIHKYPVRQLIANYVITPIIALLCFSFGIFVLDQSYVAGALCVGFGFFVALMNLMLLLIFSRIVVSDGGISAHNFGRMLKFIRWENVKKIDKVRQWNAGSRSYSEVFHVFDGDFSAFERRMVNFRGPIVFTDRIEGLRMLLDKVNEYARQHQFPLVVLDQEVARMHALRQGAGLWKRTVPALEERIVTAF